MNASTSSDPLYKTVVKATPLNGGDQAQPSFSVLVWFEPAPGQVRLYRNFRPAAFEHAMLTLVGMEEEHGIVATDRAYPPSPSGVDLFVSHYPPWLPSNRAS